MLATVLTLIVNQVLHTDIFPNSNYLASNLYTKVVSNPINI